MDRARAAVIAGDGIVARYPGLLCVARCPDHEAVTRLLDVCAGAAGSDPGRLLARRLARWMGGLDAPGDDLVFGIVSTVGDQLGVFLVGATTVSVAGGSVALSGADAATWTDKLIPQPDAPVVLALPGAAPSAGFAAGPNDLRAGVVPGAGAVLFTGRNGGTDRSSPDLAPARARDDPLFGDREPGDGGLGDRAPSDGGAAGRALDVRALGERTPGERTPGDRGLDATGAGDPLRDDPVVDARAPGDVGLVGLRPGGRPPGDGDPADYAWFTNPPDAADPGRTTSSSPSPASTPGRAAANGSPDRPAPGIPSGATPVSAAANGHAEPPTADEPTANGAVHGGRHAILETRPTGGAAVAEHADDPRDSAQVPDRGGRAGPPTLPGDDAPTTLPPRATPTGRPASAEQERTSSPHSTVFLKAAAPPPLPVDGAPALPRRVPAQRGREPGKVAEPPVAGSRLPLGRIVFDDGATFTVDAPFLVGRMPESDPRARSGELRPMVVEDTSGSVSRVHAEILINGWDVVLVDSGSRNGTFVAGPDESGWTALSPGHSSRLVPGTRVRMGVRTFVFEPGTAV